MQVENKGHYISKERDSINKLLYLMSIAKNDSDLICFLPFLRIIDSSSNEKYRNNCYTSARKLPFTTYCKLKPIQFIVLFYLEYKYYNNIKLKKGHAIKNLSLLRRGESEETELTQIDYNNLYELYYKALINNKLIKNPLKNSNYKWLIKTEPIEWSKFRKMYLHKTRRVRSYLKFKIRVYRNRHSVRGL